MMCSNSFEAQDVRERDTKKTSDSRGFLWMAITGQDFQMEGPGKIEDVKTKVHARAREALHHEVGNYVSASSGRG